MITVNTNPPGFEELIESFDEVSLPRRFFVFAPDTNRMDISLDFTGNEADMPSIPIIRDAIADYLRSDAFIAFVESDYLRDDRGANMDIDNLWPDIWFSFPREEDEERKYVGFRSGSPYNFERWTLWNRSIGDTTDIFISFFDGYNHHFLSVWWNVIYMTNGMEISIRPSVNRSILGTDYYDYETEFTDEVLALLGRIKPDLPDFFNGQFGEFLESAKWLDINEGFVITMYFDLFDSHRGSPHRVPPSPFTTIETLTFIMTAEGEWIIHED